MSDPTENDLLAEIYALCNPDASPGPDEVTAQMMADRFGGSADRWRDKLNGQYKQGTLTRREWKHGRAQTYVYKRA